MTGKITKLIFAGLDKAGKTTIHKATMEEMSASELQDLAPTKGIERNVNQFLDHDFSVWDLGGQQNYRNAYLSKPEVFNQTKALIFVIDIQDIERIEESYEYFTSILQILKNVDPAPNLYVLFHKYDPEIAGKLKSHFYRAARMFRKADKLSPQNFKFYLTSIYSNSIDLAVKRILFENFEDYEEPTQKITMTGDKKEASDDKVPLPGTTTSETLSPDVPSTPKTTSSSTSAPAPTSSAPAPATTSSTPAPPPTSSTFTSGTKTVPFTTASAPIPTMEAPKMESTTSSAPPVTKEPVATIPPVKEETTEVKSEEDELADAIPKSLLDLSDTLSEKLTNVVNKRMKETPEIAALSILSSDGEQVLAVGKSDTDYDRLETLKEVVSTLNPKQFYKELADIEYRGLGHFSLSDFDIFFARASDDYAIAVIAIDVSTMMLQNAQRIVDSIRQGMGVVESSEGAEFGEEGTPTITKKKDLVTDLRSRLKALSGLRDLD